MSTIENSHLTEVAHPSSRSNSRYCGLSTTSGAVRGGDMGGMVSAFTAVMCGTGRRTDDDKRNSSVPTSISVVENKFHLMNGDSHTPRTDLVLRRLDKNNIDRNVTVTDNSCNSSYHTAEDSVCEFADKIDISLESPKIADKYKDFPYMDGESSSSCLSTPRDINYRRDKAEQFESRGSDSVASSQEYTEEVIEISEGEYSVDEEQEEVVSEKSDVEEIERVDSELEEEYADEHECNSDCEHSEYEIDDESEVESDEEHICDSACEHSDVESAEESEYESEIENNPESDDDEHEVIEISENELSCDEDQQSDISDCECDSNCEPNCDGNHHECSSECGCNQILSESDNEIDDSLKTANTCESPVAQVNGIIKQPPLPQPRHSLNRANLLQSNTDTLNDVFSHSKTSPNFPERNNNRLQRNHSQRITQRTNEDMLGELKTAIDARIQRSASCRETAIDYRKRYAHLSSNENSISENFSKVDVKDRELRRKERRSRLRTLELKREQCLDEVRDGTEENVTDRVYREACV